MNRRHTDFQSVALPTELPARVAGPQPAARLRTLYDNSTDFKGQEQDFFIFYDLRVALIIAFERKVEDFCVLARKINQL